jgi:hypothetical protein
MSASPAARHKYVEWRRPGSTSALQRFYFFGESCQYSSARSSERLETRANCVIECNAYKFSALVAQRQQAQLRNSPHLAKLTGKRRYASDENCNRFDLIASHLVPVKCRRTSAAIMYNETSNHRTLFYNRLAKGGLVGSAVAFGSLMVLLVMPVDRNVGMVAAGAAVLLLILSAFVLILAIAARDIPTWKKNRWRYSMSSLLSLMLVIAIALGAIVAAARGVSVSRLLLAYGGFIVVAFIFYTFYINWFRFRHFNAMNAQGRYLDWNSVAAAVSRGEGTLLIGWCYEIPTVWWSDRRISTVDEARAAIESDAIITICPERKHISNWLKSTFPTVPVIEVPPPRFNSLYQSRFLSDNSPL